MFLHDMDAPLTAQMSHQHSRASVSPFENGSKCAVAKTEVVRLGGQLTGGGRGEKTGSAVSEKVLRTLRTGTTGVATTLAIKNQNGIRKARTRLSAGCVTIKQKAAATHKYTTNRHAVGLILI